MIDYEGMPVEVLSRPEQKFPADWVMCTHYGVPLAWVGEDTHLVAPGHIDPRKMAGAVLAHERECETSGTWDSRLRHTEVKQCMAAFAETSDSDGEWLWWGAETPIPATIPITVVES